MKEAPSPSKKNILPLLLRLVALLVTCALVAGAGALILYRDRLNLDALERWLHYRSLETDEGGDPIPFTHAGGARLDMARLDTGILFSGEEGAHYYAVNGELYAEEVLSLDAPVLHSSHRAGVVYDAGGQKLFLFQEGEETLRLTLEGQSDLLSARVNDEGWLAVTAQQSGYKGAVTVYDSVGEKVIRISLSSTFLVDAALSPDCKRVAVLTISQTQGRFDSKLLFYPVNGTEPTSTLELGDLLVLDMDYEDDRLWLLGDDRLICASHDGIRAEYPLSGSHLKGFSLKGEGFALLLLSDYESGGADRAITLGPDCTVLGELPLSGQVLDFDCAGQYAALLTGRDYTIYTPDLAPYAHTGDTLGARYTCLRRDGSAVLADHQTCRLYIPD